MQKLTYVPSGSTLGADDNVTLELAAPFILGSVSGTGAAGTTMITSNMPGVDGDYLQAIRNESRIIRCTVHVEGQTRKEMYANRFALIQRLRSSLELGMLYYTNDYITLRIQALPKDSPEFTERIRNYNKANIDFYCPSPYWEALSPQTQRIAYTGLGFSFPIRLEPAMQFGLMTDKAEVIYSGSVPSPVQITINAPATNPIVISNETTGERIELRRALTLGETLYIDTTRGSITVEVVHADGSVEDAFQYIDPDSDFFALQPGKNMLRYVTWNESEPTTVSIAYRERYVGV